MIKDMLAEVKKRNLLYHYYCSDLYIFVNEQTTQMIKDYQFPRNVTQFKSETDGRQMYEIPFAYTDHYK